MTFEQTMIEYHNFFFHFPVILFTAALIADLFNYFGKTRAFTAGHWLIIAGLLTCIPTIITGLAAAPAFDSANIFLEKHRSLGFSTAISSSLYAGLRISAMIWALPLKPLHYVGFSILLVALISWTSDYGALITRSVVPTSSP